MGCGRLRFQLLHVLAAGPRISKPLDDIVQLGMFLTLRRIPIVEPMMSRRLYRLGIILMVITTLLPLSKN